MKKLLAFAMCFCTAVPALSEDKKEDTRLQDSAGVLKEVLNAPDNGIPNDLLDKSKCVVVIPSVKKAALGVGGSYGRGVMTCRSGPTFKGKWSAPAMFALEGASIGLQIGAEATDFVLLVMNEQGARSIMSSKVKLGADASAAAGPVGRTTSAEIDAAMKAEILSYSRAKGLFAGVSLEGSTLRSDDNANEAIYGQKLSAKDIITEGKGKTTPAGQELIGVLTKASPHAKA
jgi:SH3 domain-containing YSC84-like protein 1